MDSKFLSDFHLIKWTMGFMILYDSPDSYLDGLCLLPNSKRLDCFNNYNEHVKFSNQYGLGICGNGR